MNHLDKYTLKLLKPAANILSPAGKCAALSILIYHRVLPSIDPLMPGEVTTEQFYWQMRLLSKYFNVLPLNDAVRKLDDGTLPARAVCVTFDDGYADNIEVALPILKKTAVPATIFITSSYLDGGRMWNDTVREAVRRISGDSLDLTKYGLGTHDLGTTDARIACIRQLINELKHAPSNIRLEHADTIASYAEDALPNNLMLNSNQVRQLHNEGITIGAHTATHPILACIDNQEARNEIKEGRRHLETLIGNSVTLFAYPNGRPGNDYLPEHVEIVRELGFKAAVSTVWGVSTQQTNRWELPRFTPWDHQPSRFYGRFLRNYLSRPHRA